MLDPDPNKMNTGTDPKQGFEQITTGNTLANKAVISKLYIERNDERNQRSTDSPVLIILGVRWLHRGR